MSFSLFCFYLSLLYASYIISSLRPFFLKNIFFCNYGTDWILSPCKKSTAVPISFYLCYSSYNSLAYFYFFSFSYFAFLDYALPICYFSKL